MSRDIDASYDALFHRSHAQPVRRVFAHFGWSARRREHWDTPWMALAAMARPERWAFCEARPYAVLKWYLNYTFCRLKQQQRAQTAAGVPPDKFVFSRTGRRVCFNTGLLTRHDEDIFATFSRNGEARARGFADWTLDAFCTETRLMGEFDALPTVARYISVPDEAFFDGRLQVFVNYEHILGRGENLGRLPRELVESGVGRSAIEGGIGLLRKRLERNHRLAVPHWYRDHVQLLLPLYVGSDRPPVGAFVAEKMAVGYKIATVLTLEQAYMNGHVVSRMEEGWLCL